MSATYCAPAPLDAAALARLRALDPEGRNGVLVRVLAAFETSLARTLGQLAALPDPADAAVVAGVAHTLKSSSASVGALHLASTCEELERRLRGTQAAVQRHEIERLIAVGEAALTTVRAMLRA
ncbi:MAG TPA: Hpt domain-containing protein [Rubrivivax sp.]|jgi:HPt (histidine-containing phosphotransfer) domain-containing protein|nr:Hpt domain-containing protein [Pseudomonadota bacterium]HOL38456.1 Hpt domain-containing protein [Rubrivivax sp.]HPP83107.1 Hpt domain-containing protein [Rubrivivax sp.]